MKILVSSHQLLKTLNEFDFDNHFVESITALTSDDSIYIHSRHKTTELPCHIIKRSDSVIYQENTRWDWVKDLMGEVKEQPVTINIFEKKIEVIFQY